jgi:hypothetical protein
MFDPVPVLNEAGNRQVQRFDLIPHAHNVQLLFPQNQVHVLHDPPQRESVTAARSTFGKAEIIGPT